MKFCRPSLRVREIGICEPVTTTGLPNDGQEEGQRRRGVGHRVGAVQHDEAGMVCSALVKTRAMAHQSSGVALAESIGGSSSRKSMGGSSPAELSTIQAR